MFRVAHFDCIGHSVAFSDYLLLQLQNIKILVKPSGQRLDEKTLLLEDISGLSVGFDSFIGREV
jgi:hypothetical protein